MKIQEKERKKEKHKNRKLQKILAAKIIVRCVKKWILRRRGREIIRVKIDAIRKI